MKIKEFAKVVHQVAVDHGWHDPKYETHFLEYIAMIHCEWSEALQEYRNGNPLIWYSCRQTWGGRVANCESCIITNRKDECKVKYLDDKPEGMLVELADGVLRILDFLVEIHVTYWQWDTFEEMIADVPQKDLEIPFPVFIAKLHEATGRAAAGGYLNLFLLEPVMAYACAWIQKEGEDCEYLLRIKNEYNRTREYRHGGKKC